jgi:hypothetical protein
MCTIDATLEPLVLPHCDHQRRRRWPGWVSAIPGAALLSARALASCVAKSDSIFEANPCQATTAAEVLRSARSHIRLASAAKEAAALDASASASATWTAALKETRALAEASRPCLAEALATKWAGGSELGGSGPTGLRDDIVCADEVGGEQVT